MKKERESVWPTHERAQNPLAPFALMLRSTKKLPEYEIASLVAVYWMYGEHEFSSYWRDICASCITNQ